MPNTTHPPVHQGPKWIWVINGHDFPRTDVGAQLIAIGETLSRSGRLRVGENQAVVPDTVVWELKHEKMAHGPMALVFRIEWPEGEAARSSTTSARGLVIGDIDDGSEVPS